MQTWRPNYLSWEKSPLSSSNVMLYVKSKSTIDQNRKCPGCAAISSVYFISVRTGLQLKSSVGDFSWNSLEQGGPWTLHLGADWTHANQIPASGCGLVRKSTSNNDEACEWRITYTEGLVLSFEVLVAASLFTYMVSTVQEPTFTHISGCNTYKTYPTTLLNTSNAAPNWPILWNGIQMFGTVAPKCIPCILEPWTIILTMMSALSFFGSFSRTAFVRTPFLLCTMHVQTYVVVPIHILQNSPVMFGGTWQPLTPRCRFPRVKARPPESPRGAETGAGAAPTTIRIIKKNRVIMTFRKLMICTCSYACTFLCIDLIHIVFVHPSSNLNDPRRCLFKGFSIVAAALGWRQAVETELCSAAMLTPGGCVDSFGARYKSVQIKIILNRNFHILYLII